MIEVIKKPAYWLVSLNRPEVHNAFNPEMIAKITATFRAAHTEGVPLVVLKGNGKSFSAGADLNWMKSMVNFSEKENYEDALVLFDMFHAIYDCSAVTLCVAHGNVFGGGLGLLAACDLVIAEEKTKFCFSEVKWGLSPATISPFIRAKVSEPHAKLLMLTAQVFSTQEALQYGLVHKSVSSADLALAVKQVTKSILENGFEALKATKELLNSQGFHPKQFREASAKVIAQRRVSKEGQEGLNYFITKEMPQWKYSEDGVDI